MAYTFTLIEQQEITTAFNQGPDDLGQPGNHVPFYITVSDILTTDPGSGAPDDDPEVLPVRIWFEGATKVNGDQGAFSTLIREYTQTQGELHWERRFSDFQSASEVSEMQEASNQVARRAEDTLRDSNWRLQLIGDIADDDATGVAEVLFEFAQNDTINSPILGGENAAWSGVVLFSSFDDPNDPEARVDETGRLLSTGESEFEADSLDDWRNVLYAHSAYTNAVLETGLATGAGLLNEPALGDLLDDARTFFEVCLLSGRCDLSLSTAVAGQVAEDAFAPVLIFGGTDTLNLIKSGADGTVNLTDVSFGDGPLTTFGFSTNFKPQARALFGTPGPQNQSIAATVHPVDDLIAQAQSSDPLAQKALLGLSPFKVDNGVGVNVTVSDQFWADRGLMTSARLLFDARDNVAATVVSQSFVDPVEFVDLESGTQYTVDNNLLPLSDFRIITFGTSEDDLLTGGDFADSLYAAGGADTLDGGSGDDYLSGGSGNDVYLVDAGNDTLFDADGQGTVEFNGEILTGGERLAGNVWDSTDGRFRYQLLSSFQGDQLLVLDSNNPDDSLTVEDFASGDLGIELEDSQDPLPPVESFAPADTSGAGIRDHYSFAPSVNVLYEAGLQFDLVQSGGGNDVIFLGDGIADRVSGNFGNDTIHGEEGRDYILAGVGGDNMTNGPLDRDTVYGGPGVDLINTGVGDDFILGGSPGEDINAADTANQGDWVVAGPGNDVVFGTVNQDFLTAGVGADVIHGGGGFDVILADGNYTFTRSTTVILDVPPGGAREHSWNGSAWETVSTDFTQLTPGDAFEYTTSILDGDFVFDPTVDRPVTERVQMVSAPSNNDIVFGGPGTDWIAGGPGSDTLHGQADDDFLYGDDLVPMPAGAVYGNDTLFGGDGNDLLFGNAGDDTLHGDAGNDMLFGDDDGQPSGNDRLFGGAGTDELHGLDGDDFLSGGDGDDVVLLGGEGDDTIDGGSGADVLDGGAGNDTLLGSSGADQLNGGADNDQLDGGAGDDILNGDAGDDVLTGGIGVDQLDGGAGNDHYRAVLNTSSINTPDVITDSGGVDLIVFDELVFPNRIQFTNQGGDLLVQYSSTDALLISGDAGGTVIEEYAFSDGRVLSFADLTDQPRANKGSSNEITAFDDWFEGGPGPETLDMLAGDDAVLAAGGDDSISGGDGDDLLDGGDGNDVLNGDAGSDRLFGAAGSDSLAGNAGADLLAGGADNDNLEGGAGTDSLRGGDGDDLLFGGDGDDFLQGDRGADQLVGGPGFDHYLVKPQDDPAPAVMPRTEIFDSSFTGGNAVVFLGGLDTDDVILINDLDSGDLEIQYGHQETAIMSSIHIAGGAEGQIITEFQFTNGSSISFENLCLAQPDTCEPSDLIFGSSFEGAAASVTDGQQLADPEPGHSTVLAEPALGTALIAAALIKGLIRG